MMRGINQGEFNQIINQLQNYGKSGCEEIHFEKRKGIFVPILTIRPKESVWEIIEIERNIQVAKKVIEFLKENQAYAPKRRDNIKHLANVLLEKIEDAKEKQLLVIQFNTLIKRIDNTVQKNPAFACSKGIFSQEKGEKLVDTAWLQGVIEILSKSYKFSESYQQNPVKFELVCRILYPIYFCAIQEDEKQLNFLLQKSNEDLAFILNLSEDQIGEKWQNYVVRKSNWAHMYQNSNQESYGKMMHHTIKTASLLLSEKGWKLSEIVDFLAMR